VAMGQDSRLSFFSVAMPASSGKHTTADKFISMNYDGCLFCGATDPPVTKAHLVAGNSAVDYSVFGLPTYIDALDVKCVRNFIPLCGVLGKENSCHDQFDKYKIAMMYNPLESSYYLHCLDPTFAKYEELHMKRVMLRSGHIPYRRILAWRARKCLQEHGYLVSKADTQLFIDRTNFSEESQSMKGKGNNVAESSTSSTTSSLMMSIASDAK